MEQSKLASAAQDMFVEFTERIRDLEALALLKLSASSESDLRILAAELNKAEALMDELQRMVERDLVVAKRTNETTQRLKNARWRALRLERHLSMVDHPIVSETSQNETKNEEMEAEEDEDNTISIISKANLKSGPIQLSVPSVKQFESIPKYMRSLINSEIFKRVCELINLAADRKRLVQEASQDRLGPTARASRSAWNAQATSDVSNLTFVTDDDITCEVENDKSCNANDVKAALQCLRNLDFIRVAPFENLNRYVFLK